MEIRVNEVTLHYKKIGSGDPIVLLHGNGESHQIFDKLSERLKNDFTVYAIDSRNHGQSEMTADYSYETMMEDVYRFIQALSLEKANFIGFSDGAIISLVLSIKYPDVVKKMALLGINLKPEDFTEEIYRDIKETYLETKDPLFKMMLEQPNIELDTVKNLNIPTLVIAAENDLFKPETFTDLVEALPDAMLKIIPGQDHGSYIVDQDMLYPDLYHFLTFDSV